MSAVVGVFKQPVVVKLPNAGESPFMSDTYVFTKQLETFFHGAKATPKKSSKTGEKKEKKGKTETTKGKTTTSD